MSDKTPLERYNDTLITALEVASRQICELGKKLTDTEEERDAAIRDYNQLMKDVAQHCIIFSTDFDRYKDARVFTVQCGITAEFMHDSRHSDVAEFVTNQIMKHVRSSWGNPRYRSDSREPKLVDRWSTWKTFEEPG